MIRGLLTPMAFFTTLAPRDKMTFMITKMVRDYNPVFNPGARIERVPLSNGSSYFVIDDALVDPERMVRFAVENLEHFRNVDFNAYPGVFLLTPVIAVGLSQFFNQHIRRLFDARRLLHMHCRLSMVTLPSDALRPFQRMCHRDIPVLEPRHSIQASILYLFKDSRLGGTSFYEPARPQEEMVALFTDASTLPSQAFDIKYRLQPGYQFGSNHYFACVGTAQAKWNRLIFYDGYTLHSGDIMAPERLTADPMSGRLTLNAFFTCRRNVSPS
jgi:hypothetical protein